MFYALLVDSKKAQCLRMTGTRHHGVTWEAIECNVRYEAKTR